MTEPAYVERARQWARALKLYDPSIKLVLCGQQAGDVSVLEHWLQCRGPNLLGEERVSLLDMYSVRLCTTVTTDHYEKVTLPLAAERTIAKISLMIEAVYNEDMMPSRQPRPRICFDEWNGWWSKPLPGSQEAKERYTLSDALVVSMWLNVFVRNSKAVEMATMALSADAISSLMTADGGLIRQTIWYPYKPFAKYMQGELIAGHLACAEYDGPRRLHPRQFDLIGLTRPAPCLDASATVDGEGWVTLAVVNIHETDSISAAMSGVSGPVQVYMVTSPRADCTNMDGKHEVGITKSRWTGLGDFVFRRLSLTMLRWRT